eukprot:7159855-Lingulodinium_polyedra.AAC.1
MPAVLPVWLAERLAGAGHDMAALAGAQVLEPKKKRGLTAQQHELLAQCFCTLVLADKKNTMVLAEHRQQAAF